MAHNSEDLTESGEELCGKQMAMRYHLFAASPGASWHSEIQATNSCGCSLDIPGCLLTDLNHLLLQTPYTFFLDNLTIGIHV